MSTKETMQEIKERSRKRIIELIQEYCDGSQQVFVEKTKLNKGAVSQYVNGKKTPTNIAASIIGDTFHVSTAWVMGFNVPRLPGIELSVEEMLSEINQIYPDKRLYTLTPMEYLGLLRYKLAPDGIKESVCKLLDIDTQASYEENWKNYRKYIRAKKELEEQLNECMLQMQQVAPLIEEAEKFTVEKGK